VESRPAGTAALNYLSVIFLAFAMSTDAFAAAIGKGATLHQPKLREALRTGLIFGVIEGITPVIGWAIGLTASRYITAWDHWIAFALLLVLGGRMILAGFRAPTEAEDKPTRHTFWVLAVTAFATSIDALAVGVGLAFIDVNIASAAVTIGLATMLMVTMGVMLGRVLGRAIGRRAEMLGGVVLIVVGATIVYQHLHAA